MVAAVRGGADGVVSPHPASAARATTAARPKPGAACFKASGARSAMYAPCVNSINAAPQARMRDERVAI